MGIMNKIKLKTDKTDKKSIIVQLVEMMKLNKIEIEALLVTYRYEGNSEKGGSTIIAKDYPAKLLLFNEAKHHIGIEKILEDARAQIEAQKRINQVEGDPKATITKYTS